MFVFGIPGFSLVRSGGLQGCQSCQGSGCALRNTNLLTHRAVDCDRQRSATSRKCFQVENSVLFFTPFSFRMRRPFFWFFVCFLFYFFSFYADQKSWKINFGFLAFLRFHSSVVFVFCFFAFAAQQATRLFVFVVLFCFILFPLSAARCFPPFFILPRHLSFPLPNTRTLNSPSYSHSRLVCFSPHSRNVS